MVAPLLHAHQRLVGDGLGAGERRLAAFGDDLLHLVGRGVVRVGVGHGRLVLARGGAGVLAVVVQVLLLRPRRLHAGDLVAALVLAVREADALVVRRELAVRVGRRLGVRRVAALGVEAADVALALVVDVGLLDGRPGDVGGVVHGGARRAGEVHRRRLLVGRLAHGRLGDVRRQHDALLVRALAVAGRLRRHWAGARVVDVRLFYGHLRAVRRVKHRYLGHGHVHVARPVVVDVRLLDGRFREIRGVKDRTGASGVGAHMTRAGVVDIRLFRGHAWNCSGVKDRAGATHVRTDVTRPRVLDIGLFYRDASLVVGVEHHAGSAHAAAHISRTRVVHERFFHRDASLVVGVKHCASSSYPVAHVAGSRVVYLGLF